MLNHAGMRSFVEDLVNQRLKIQKHVRLGNCDSEIEQLTKTQWFVFTWVSFCSI